MLIDVLIIASCLVFLLLAGIATYFIIWSRRVTTEMNKKFDKAFEELEEFSTEAKDLMQNVGELADDAKEKLEALDFVFEPLKEMNEISEVQKHQKTHKTIQDVSDVMECVSSGLTLYQKIRGGIERYVRSR